MFRPASLCKLDILDLPLYEENTNEYDSDSDSECLNACDLGTIGRSLTSNERNKVVKCGPQPLPSSFPADNKGRNFPVKLLKLTLENNECVTRDWIVWISSKQSIFCFPCCPFIEDLPLHYLIRA